MKYIVQVWDGPLHSRFVACFIRTMDECIVIMKAEVENGNMVSIREQYSAYKEFDLRIKYSKSN